MFSGILVQITLVLLVNKNYIFVADICMYIKKILFTV